MSDFPNNYCPITPTQKQQQFLSATELEVFFGGAAGGGKALYTGTMIPTPAGWTTMEHLQPGDFVFGMDGKPTRILAVSGVMTRRPCWRLTFDDGSQFVADAEHRWLTYDLNELTALTRRNPVWRKARRERRASRVTGNKSTAFTASLIARNRRNPPPTKSAPIGTVRTTAEICRTLTLRGRANHAVPLGGSLELPDADLPLDPYVLGAWLGDGNTRSAGFTTADLAVVRFIRQAGWSVVRRGGKHTYAWRIGTPVWARRSNNRPGIVNPFTTALQQLGVLNNKHVPQVYLRASRSQRLALLQGLMDTDGTVARASGSAEFTNTNRRLAEAVLELACSLGHKASLRKGRARLKRRDCGPKWTVKWVPPEIVFRLTRKAKLQSIARRRTRKFRYVVACDRIKSVPVRCIQVAAPDGMYLAGPAMIPTHNSNALLMAALQYVHVPGYAALILRKDTQRLALAGGLIPRSHEWLASNPAATWNAARRQWSLETGAAPATITFGYLTSPTDKFRYASSEFQLIAFDELTELPEADYLFLFSRLRKAGTLGVPLRMRSASNPGNLGHAWVKQRFVEVRNAECTGRNEEALSSTPHSDLRTPHFPDSDRLYIPSRLDDNPHLDAAAYRRSLIHLPPVERERLLAGDWSVQERGLILADWLRYYTESRSLTPSETSVQVGAAMPAPQAGEAGSFAAPVPHGVSDLHCVLNLLAPDGRLVAVVDPAACRRFITVDPAGTSAERAAELRGQERSFTVAQVWEQPRGELSQYLILRHQIRGHFSFRKIKLVLEELHAQWRPERIWVENERLGPAILDALHGLPVSTVATRGRDKAVRATRLLDKLQAGHVFLPQHENSWRHDFEKELLAWTGHGREPSDQIDAAAYAAIIADTAAPGIIAVQPIVVR